jgi:hypothetical protein
MNWLITFTIGIIVGQEFNSIPRIKPILQDGFQKVIEYSSVVKPEQENQKEQYYESFWSIPTIFKLYNHEEKEDYKE